MTVRILSGDCRAVLKTLPDNSVDAIVTDPPYHLTTAKKGGSGEASVNLESPHGRARIGTGFMGLLDQMAGAPDIDLVSAAVWVSRRIRGEAVAFDAVAVTYADMLAEGFDIVSPGAEEADPSDPEG